jgi:hypothetical protein
MLGAMVQIGSVVLNVTDIGRAAAFWRPPDASFVVLSDTEGNLFCVVNTEGGAQV